MTVAGVDMPYSNDAALGAALLLDGLGSNTRAHVADLRSRIRGGAEGWFLNGWCELRHAGRIFRLDRIKSAHRTRRSATHRDVDEGPRVEQPCSGRRTQLRHPRVLVTARSRRRHQRSRSALVAGARSSSRPSERYPTSCALSCAQRSSAHTTRSSEPRPSERASCSQCRCWMNEGRHSPPIVCAVRAVRGTAQQQRVVLGVTVGREHEHLDPRRIRTCGRGAR